LEEERDDLDGRVRALLARVAEGDQEAVDELYRLHQREMIAAAHARLGQTLHGLTESIDLVQSVWTDILDDIEDFEYRGPGSFRRWLRSCLLNKIQAKRRYHHAEKRETGKLERLPAVGVPSASRTDPTPSQAAAGAEEVALLRRILERFPEPQRQALSLRMRDERSYAEIGAEIGRSAEAAKKLYQRGLERLIEMLPQEWLGRTR